MQQDAWPSVSTLILFCYWAGRRSSITSELHSVRTQFAGWTIGVLGFDFRRGVWIFLFTVASRRALGPTQPPIQWVPCAGGKAAWVWI